jgi:hypothetical protein
MEKSAIAYFPLVTRTVLGIARETKDGTAGCSATLGNCGGGCDGTGVTTWDCTGVNSPEEPLTRAAPAEYGSYPGSYPWCCRFGSASIWSSMEPERAVEGGVGGALYCPVTTLCNCVEGVVVGWGDCVDCCCGVEVVNGEVEYIRTGSVLVGTVGSGTTGSVNGLGTLSEMVWED